MYYVYLLRSEADGNYYIGQTENIDDRLATHNSGRVISTRRRTPFILVGYEQYPTRKEARWREHQLKKSAHQREKFIEKYIPG